MRQVGEPSVEEILHSIKKVIARDNLESAQAEKHRRETGSFVSDSSPGPVNPDEADEILDLGEAASEMADRRETDEEPEESLIDRRAADAMRQSLAALTMLSEPGASPQIVRSGETSLEGLVREMLRPMLAQWLDTHLPDLVERLVKAEIARIAGKKG